MKNEYLTLPPSRAFMDNITIFVPSKIAADGLLQRYYDLFTWVRMKAKPKKSQSQGDLFQNWGWYDPNSQGVAARVSDVFIQSHWVIVIGVQRSRKKGLKSIDKTCLPGKMKTWCYQHSLLPRLLWSLQMYEIAISRVERIQHYSNKYLRKWLGVSPCFSKVGLYTNSGNLQLPISSLVEELKIGKVRLHMMMKDSADEIIRKAYPEIKLDTKWSAVKVTQEAECSLRIKKNHRRHSNQSSRVG